MRFQLRVFIFVITFTQMIFLINLTDALATQNAPEQDMKKQAMTSGEMGDAHPFQSVQFGQGTEFRSPDNLFFMALRFRMQNRADISHIHHPSAGQASILNEWQVRRARMRLNGYVVDPKLKYVLQLSFSRRDMDWDSTSQPNVLRDAMIMYELTDDWQIGFGQGKLPGNRQRVISSGDLQFVDRSIVNSSFNIDRDFGFQSQYRKKLNQQILIGKVAVVAGEGRNRNVTPDDQLYYVGRVEWLPLGEFKNSGDYSESDLAFEEVPKISTGYTYASMAGSPRANGTVGTTFTTDGASGSSIVRRDQQVHLADVLFKYRGFSTLLEYAYRDGGEARVNSRQGLLLGHGLNLQVGKMLSGVTEVALKYSTIRPNAASYPWHSMQNDWAAVFSYFFKGHRVKLQTEIGLLETRETYARLQFELGI